MKTMRFRRDMRYAIREIRFAKLFTFLRLWLLAIVMKHHSLPFWGLN
jgi:hypothetical protein